MFCTFGESPPFAVAGSIDANACISWFWRLDWAVLYEFVFEPAEFCVAFVSVSFCVLLPIAYPIEFLPRDPHRHRVHRLAVDGGVVPQKPLHLAAAAQR
jgi:hypothetical protein